MTRSFVPAAVVVATRNRATEALGTLTRLAFLEGRPSSCWSTTARTTARERRPVPPELETALRAVMG
jgi:hypothetical protein